MNRARHRLLAVALGAVAGIVFLEGFARLARPDLVERPRLDAGIGWSTGEYERFDPAEPPPDGRLRLLALGDSYMSPDYRTAKRDLRWPAEIEFQVPERITTAVLSAAGWGTDQELLAFEAKGAAWRPDLVVLCFCANNDLVNLLATNNGPGSSKPFFVLEQGLLTLRDAAGRPYAMLPARPRRSAVRSVLADWLRVRIRELGLWRVEIAAGVPAPYARWTGREEPPLRELLELPERIASAPQNGPHLVNAYTREDFDWNRYQWELLDAVIGRLDADVRAIDARLIVMHLPMTLSSTDPRFLAGAGFTHRFETPTGPFTLDLDASIRRLGALCAARGIEFWNPCPDFCAEAVRPGRWDVLFPEPGNRHWSRYGHEWLARWMETRIRAELR